MTKITRRNFITGAVLGGAAVAGAALAGCAPTETTGTDGNGTAAGTTPGTTPGTTTGTSDLFTPPTPITNIAETEETDVLVLGAGIAGVSCALSAIESGARVTVLQKSSTVLTTGNGMCAYNVPECHERNGLPYVDFNEKLIELNNANNGGSNIPLLRRFFEMEVEAVTWFLEESKTVGAPPDLYIHPDPAWPDPVIVWMEIGINGISQRLAEKAEELGAVFHYSTPAVQLVTDSSGAVIGAIGEREDGTFIQVNASKGVVLATGDYSNNKELLEIWCPAAAEFQPYAMPERNGDGYLMGIWANAVVAPHPHTKTVHSYPYLNMQVTNPWMLTDLHGDRVMPEDMIYDWRCNAIRGHRDNKYVQFFDSNYPQYLSEMGLAEFTDEELADYVDKGWFFIADTLEELVELTDMDDDNNLLATIERYNELVAQGTDTDFFKDARYLKPIDTPPYYAAPYVQFILSISAGLQVNEDCAVINTELRPIQGLYAIGNCQGGFFGGADYPFIINCGNVGRCSVFGYTVGRALAEA
jgi:succinate dehydrogenase/fumarate reductase flavoprotein subunit